MQLRHIEISTDKTEINMTVHGIFDIDNHSYLKNTCVCEWNTTFRINEDYGNGWQGDPLAIRQKNKNSDPTSIHLEIVCEQSYADTSSLDTLSNEDGIATLHTQQWTHINTIRAAMEKIGTSLLEELTTRYEQGKLDAFKAYTDTIQGRMTHAWENTFGPLVDVPSGNGTDNFNYGGYVLLRPILNFRDSTRPINNEHYKVRLMTVSDTPEENENVLVTTRDPSLVFTAGATPDVAAMDIRQDATYMVVAGSLNMLTRDVVETLYPTGNVPPLDDRHPGVDLSVPRETVPYCSLVETQLDIGKFRADATMQEMFDWYDRKQPQDALPDIQLKMRPLAEQLHTDIDNVLLDRTPMNDTDPAVMHTVPSYMDVKVLSNEQHFIDEYKTLIKLVGQCLLSTTFRNTPRQRGRRLGAGINTERKSTRFLNNVYNARARNNPCVLATPQLDITDYQQYVNDIEPWRHEDDGEYGACCEYLFTPCLKYASRFLRSTIPNLPDIGSVLINALPFGFIDPVRTRVIDAMITKALQQKVFTNNKLQKIILRRNTTADDMPFAPLILQYGLRIDDKHLRTFSWSLGETPTIVVEALQLALLYLQKVVHDVVHEDVNDTSDYRDTVNRRSNIQKREKDTGWDTYPYGIVHPQHVSGYRHIYEESPLSTLIQHPPPKQITTDSVLLVPGTKPFYEQRSAIRKEVRYHVVTFVSCAGVGYIRAIFNPELVVYRLSTMTRYSMCRRSILAALTPT